MGGFLSEFWLGGEGGAGFGSSLGFIVVGLGAFIDGLLGCCFVSVTFAFLSFRLFGCWNLSRCSSLFLLMTSLLALF